MVEYGPRVEGYGGRIMGEGIPGWKSGGTLYCLWKEELKFG